VPSARVGKKFDFRAMSEDVGYKTLPDDVPQIQRSKTSREEIERKQVLKYSLIGLAVVVIVVLVIMFKENVKDVCIMVWDMIKSMGAASIPVVFILTWVLTAFSGPVVVMEMAGGALYVSLFGMTTGTLIGLATIAPPVYLGCLTSFVLGRRYFKHHVAHLIKKHEFLNTVNEIISEEGWKFAFMMRLNPLIPFELFNLAVSLTDITFLQNAIATLGTMPLVCFEVYTAGSAANIANDAAEGGKDTSEKIKETIIKLLICAMLIVAVGCYGKKKYDEKVAQKEKHFEGSE